MSVTLNFTPPKNFNLDQWQLGQSATESDALTLVASGTNIGSYPEWINQLTWSGGQDFWYAVRFKTDDGHTTSWSDRMHGKYGAGIGYFIHNPSGSHTIYLVVPPSSGSATIPTWLSYNQEYTVSINCSGLYGDGTDYMEEDYSFFFTSEYCPLWSAVESVRMIVGPIIDGIPDDTINRMIHRASWSAITEFFEETNPYGCSYSTIPEPVYRWVTCMAGLFALNAAIAGGGTGVGNTTKRLGTLSVSYDGSTDGATPGDIRKQLIECIQKSADYLSAVFGKKFKSVIKSYNNKYIIHPLRDVAWGRQPRHIPDDGILGPWYNATRDYVKYSESSASGRIIQS